MTYITKCRSCSSSSIKVVLELGDQALSGVFRSNDVKDILSGPLTLISCDSCYLVQLANSYPLKDMYNEGYGYKSGLTLYMRQHLKNIKKFATSIVSPSANDTVLDIGLYLKLYHLH